MSMMQKRAILKCVCCEPMCYSVTGFDGRYYWGHTAEDAGTPEFPPGSGIHYWTLWGQPAANSRSPKIKCHKLLVWEGISIADNDIPTSIGAPDHVLDTNGGFARYDIDRLPFFEEGPGGSTLLSSPPYWYSGCNAGGWAESTIEHYPSGAQLDTMWNESPIPDGTYTLIVGVRAWRRYKQGASPGLGLGVEEIVSAANGRFAVAKIWLREE